MCVEGGLGVRRPSSERVSPSHGTVRGWGEGPCRDPWSTPGDSENKSQPWSIYPAPPKSVK